MAVAGISSIPAINAELTPSAGLQSLWASSKGSSSGNQAQGELMNAAEAAAIIVEELGELQPVPRQHFQAKYNLLHAMHFICCADSNPAAVLSSSMVVL